MNGELEETVRKVAEYSNEDKRKITKRMHLLFIGGVIAAILYLILVFTDHADNFLGGLCMGIQLGMMIVRFFAVRPDNVAVIDMNNRMFVIPVPDVLKISL